MTRVKRGNVSRKKHKKILKLAKGFQGKLSKIYRQAKPAVFHALSFAYRDRRNKKRDFRRLWITRISAGLTNHQMRYSVFINQLGKSNIQINRKMLSELAYHHPNAFGELVAQVSK